MSRSLASFVSKDIDRKFRAIVNQVVDARDKSGSRRDDLLQVILDLRDKHGRTRFNENIVVGHSLTFLVSFSLHQDFASTYCKSLVGRLRNKQHHDGIHLIRVCDEP